MANLETYTLSWHTYSDHLKSMLDDMMNNADLSDVTLVSDDKKLIKAHKVVLRAASPVFRSIIDNLPANSVIYFKGIHHQELKAITDFMYLGETSCQKEDVNEFLKVASNLEIKGLQQSNDNCSDVINDVIDIKEEDKSNSIKLYEENNVMMESSDFEVNTAVEDAKTSEPTLEENDKHSVEILDEGKPNWLEGRTNKHKKPAKIMEKDGFLFRMGGTNKNRTYFHCTKYNSKPENCRASAIVDIEKDLILEISYIEDHTHVPDPIATIVQSIEEEGIKEGLVYLQIKPAELYRNIQDRILNSEAGEKGLSYLKSLSNFSSRLYQKRYRSGLREKKCRVERKKIRY